MVVDQHMGYRLDDESLTTDTSDMLDIQIRWAVSTTIVHRLPTELKDLVLYFALLDPQIIGTL